MKAYRIFAIVLRHLFLLKRSPHRLFALFYWSTLELFLWGFFTIYLNSIGASSFNFISLLLGALIFWNLFTGVQHSITVSFSEDIWSRNISNIFASPISLMELIAGLVILGIFQEILAMSLMVVLAQILYAFNIFQFGMMLIPFIGVLFIFAWGVGIATLALILRLGPSADILAWSIPALIQPVSAVFYPVAVLPNFLQKIAWFFPTSHIFEGMRAVILKHSFSSERLFVALILSVIYFAIALIVLHFTFRVAKKKGLMVRFYTE